MKYIIDCGHGGIDPRTGKYTDTAIKVRQSVVNGKTYYEGVINRTIGGMLAHLLEWAGHEVIFTVHPNDHRDLSLAQRVRVANRHPDGIFVSIHCNGFDGRAKGFEVWTSVGDTKSDKVAQNIYDKVEALSKPFGLKMRFDKSDGDSDKEKDYYVVKKTKGSSVLIECFFYDNAEDISLYHNEEFIKKFVSALYKGLI